MEIKGYDLTAWMSHQGNQSNGGGKEDRRNDFKTKTELYILGALRKHSIWLSSWWQDKHPLKPTVLRPHLPGVQQASSSSRVRLALFIINEGTQPNIQILSIYWQIKLQPALFQPEPMDQGIKLTFFGPLKVGEGEVGRGWWMGAKLELDSRTRQGDWTWW